MAKLDTHEEISIHLPWYVNDSLGRREQAQVNAHLANCQDCQDERNRLQQLHGLVVEDHESIPDYRFAHRNLMARINEAERNRASTEPFSSTAGRRWLPMTGVAGVLLAVLVTVGAVQEEALPVSEFRTLTSPVLSVFPGDEVTRRVGLTFEQPITATAMRRALIDTRSNIVSGPDEKGVYVVEMPVAADWSDERFVETIRDIEGVVDVSLVP